MSDIKSLQYGKVWPTIALAAASWAVIGVTGTMLVMEKISFWLAVAVLSIANYVVFTSLHEAVHGNLERGKQGWKTVLFGYACGLTFLAPFRLFRALHLTHHAHTNHPEKDPDYFVKAPNALVALLKCFAIYPFYLTTFLRSNRPLPEKLCDTALVAVYWIVPYLMLQGHLELYMGLIVLPTWFGTTIISFILDWVPHFPHESQDYHTNTKNIPGVLPRIIMVGHSTHRLHHQHPHVPFFRYKEAQDRLDEIAAERAA